MKRLRAVTTPGFSVPVLAALAFGGVALGHPASIRAQENDPAASAAPTEVVHTAAGQIRGFVDESRNVNVFRGIHYGQPTGGSNRFMPPHAVAPWDGIRDATRFGDVCPQTDPGGRGSLQQEEPMPMSEDCLALNVWTPGLTGARPVMVWLHGRGYNAGAGSEGWYDGSNLAAHGDVVVVTINHRLNVFGYLYLSEVAGEAFDASGIVGLLDAQLALEWVRDNIRAFGGDPDNVTIFGESGGGSKVATLMGMPSAKGLFHKGIIQSGPSRTGTPADDAAANAERVMDLLGVDTAEELQAVPFMDLLTAVGEAGLLGVMRPVVDGHYLPRDMFVDRSTDSAVGVPLMIGSNRDEQIYFSRNEDISRDMGEEELLERIRALYGADAEFVIEEYRTSRPAATPWELFIAIGSARMTYGSIQLAEVHRASAPVYLYMFEFEASRQSLATHAAEVRFAFRNASGRPNAMPGAAQVEDQISGAWIAFARHGSPNHPGIPEWPTYDIETRPTMVFNVESAVVNDLRPIERRVHDRVGLRQ
jgi:para-nitrobenzyl esterase